MQNIDHVIDAVHHVTGISYEEMKLRTRRRVISDARQWVFYFAKGPVGKIGRTFGRHYSTVIYSRKTRQSLIDVDREVKRTAERIKYFILDCDDLDIMEMCINVSYK